MDPARGPKKKADIKRILLIGIPLLAVAIGMKAMDDEARILWFEKNGTHSTAARFYLFSGEKERVLKANEEQTVEIRWRPELERGELELEMEVSGTEPVFYGGSPRDIEVDLEKGERVYLTVHGTKAKGRFVIEWEKQ